MQSAGDGGRAKTTSQTQKTRPDVVHPKHTGEAHERKSKSSQVNPVSAVRSQEQNQNAPVQKPVPKPVQFTAADPDAPQTPDQISQLNKSGAAAGGAVPRPEEVPLGLGVRLERRVVEEVELRTRGQRENPAWFAWRLNRITASAAHRIAHCRFVSGTSQTPPASYLAAITGEGPRVQTRAMSWGIQREEEAVRRYQVLKSRALGRDVTVRDCGLFIDAQRSWLAASPDGIVTDSRTGQWLLCLEVKCPYKHRERSVEEACRDDRAFCLEIQQEEEEEEEEEEEGRG
uniref:uncharacterized protein n=1 Tax=Centroberyx gerrardi TaxID=166262 RepID=UPI003AAFED08